MSDGTERKYLRDINDKVSTLLERLDDRVNTVLGKLDEVTNGLVELGVRNSEAFERLRGVIKSLHDVTEALAVQQKGTREDLAEYGGTIEADSWWS